MPLPKSEDVAAALMEKHGNSTKPCAECGTNQWTLDQNLWGVPRMIDGAATPFVDTNSALVLISVSCDNCGYVKFHNVNRLGFTIK